MGHYTVMPLQLPPRRNRAGKVPHKHRCAHLLSPSAFFFLSLSLLSLLGSERETPRFVSVKPLNKIRTFKYRQQLLWKSARHTWHEGVLRRHSLFRAAYYIRCGSIRFHGPLETQASFTGAFRRFTLLARQRQTRTYRGALGQGDWLL